MQLLSAKFDSKLIKAIYSLLNLNENAKNPRVLREVFLNVE